MLLVVSSIIVPFVMLLLQKKSKIVRLLFNVLAVFAMLVFGGIASTSIYQIIVDNAVFMTTIHAIFLNPLFLVSGAYIGVFIIYRLMLLTWHENNINHLT
ncbi:MULTISPECIES: transposase [unclassified Lysinibacillus]|uniref:transposase n=1 Tax=unclassified Lysinibacillus TaxID=2636778 RepID=UPI0030FB2984